MKNEFIKKMFLVGIVSCFAISLYAQKPIVVEETQCKFKHGEHPGFRLIIPETSYDAVAKTWTKKVEKRTKSKVVIEDGEYSIFGAVLIEISETPVNVYSVIRSQDSVVVFDFAFEMKPKEFLSREQSEKEYALVMDFLKQFGKDEYTIVATDQLKQEEKKLSTLEKELSSLQNAKAKYEKTIVSNQNDILKYNDEIDLLKQDATQLNELIGKEKQTLLTLEAGETRDAKENQIKGLEKDKKRVMKEIESLQKKIVDSNSDIHIAELDIESNVNEQLAKTGEVDQQKLVVGKSTTKLNTIMTY